MNQVIMSLSLNEAKTIVTQDLGRGNDQEALQVMLACNIWFALAQDVHVPVGIVGILKSTIVDMGLVEFHSQLEKYATEMLSLIEDAGRDAVALSGTYFFSRNGCDNSSIGLALDAILAYWHKDERCEVVHGGFASMDLNFTGAVTDCLQFLCFFDRFTYARAPYAEAAAIEKFKAVNRKCGMIARGQLPGPGATVISFVRNAVADVFPRQLKFHADAGKFSSGVCSDAREPLSEKVRAYAHYHCNFGDDIRYPIPGGKSRYLKNVPQLMVVPKGMVTRRVIAPESACMNYNGQAYLAELRRVNKKIIGTPDCPGFINERFSEFNRDLARIGSVTGGWATIDSSSFSDSICRKLFFELLPCNLWGAFLSCSSEYAQYNEEIIRLHMLYTSGNAMTWETESHYSISLARAALALAGQRHPEKYVWSFGDDLIVPSQHYEVVKEVFELFGHTVNGRKSYFAGLFRESCGGWYLGGVEVTPIYWPRKALPTCRYYRTDKCRHCKECKQHTLVASLCDMQHRFWRFPHTREVITHAVLELFPTMTYSSVGEECDDLWAAQVDPYFSERYPHFRLVSSQMSGAEVREVASPQLSHWVYYQYLKHGPLYDDGLSELLGISSPRLTAACIDLPKIRYRKS